jgi:hypothetical protein
MIWPAGQCCGQKVGLNPIISSDSLYDRLIYLNEFFRIVGAVIAVNVAAIEFILPSDLSEWSCQSMEVTPARDHHGGVRVLALTHLRSSMKLRRSSRSKLYSHMLRF